MIDKDSNAKTVREQHGSSIFPRWVYHFESSDYRSPDWDETTYQSILKTQENTPVVGKKDRRVWWLFKKNFYYEDEGHSADEVKAFVTGNAQGTSKPDAPLKDTMCLVCEIGTILSGRIAIIATDSFLECNHCHTQYYFSQGKIVLRNVPTDNSKWRIYEQQILSLEEMHRISQGGYSDAQLAKRQEEERLRLAKEEEEKRKSLQRKEEITRRRQTPGTGEWYIAKFNSIMGMPEDATGWELRFTAQSSTEWRKHVAHVRQLQKELRLLKRELNLKRKDYAVRNEWPLYNAVVKDIDSGLLKLDELKLDMERRALNIKPLSVAKEKETGDMQRELKKEESTTVQPASKKQEEFFELGNLLTELNSLIGLESVKAEVTELINFLKVQKLRQAKGMPTAPISLHVVFYGNPGTGKTSVARLLSKIYKSLGFLSSGHLVETDRSGLVAGYVGQTALKVSDVVNKALGGILFIDEAYSLTTTSSGNDYGIEAIDTLIKLMEDNRGNLAIIVAGYTEKMERFLSSNPGLRSRFNRFWRFEDYAPEQLVAITGLFCKSAGFRLTQQSSAKLQILFQNAYANRDEAFGNARLARNVFESAISNQASRIVGLANVSEDTLATVEADDIPDELMTDIS